MRFCSLKLRKHFTPGVAISNQTVLKTGTGRSTALASITYRADGTTTDQTPTTLETWLLTGASSDYEIRATLTDGAAGGTFGSWLGLGVNRTWSLSGAPGDNYTATIYIEIIDVATQTLQDSATVTLEVYNI